MYTWIKPLYYYFVFPRNKHMKPVPRRNFIDVGRERWKDGGGRDTNVMFVSGHVGGQGHRHQDADPRPGPGAVPSLLGAPGAGTGGESVLQQVPGQNPKAAQVGELISESPPENMRFLKYVMQLLFTCYETFSTFLPQSNDIFGSCLNKQVYQHKNVF